MILSALSSRLGTICPKRSYNLRRSHAFCDSTGSQEDEPSTGSQEEQPSTIEYSEEEESEKDEQDRQVQHGQANREGQGEQVAQADPDSLDGSLDFFDADLIQSNGNQVPAQQQSGSAVSKSTPSVKLNSPKARAQQLSEPDALPKWSSTDAKRLTGTWLTSTVLVITFQSYCSLGLSLYSSICRCCLRPWVLAQCHWPPSSRTRIHPSS